MITSAQPRFTVLWDTDLRSSNPLDFDGYRPPEGADESVRAGIVESDCGSVVVIECRFDQVGGTMGAVAGERVVRAFDRATALGLPVAALVASGGARLQEGMVSLVQLGRTAAAVARHRAAGLLYVAVLRPHTTGGVYASWASLADLIAAEPGATVGFGGPRVVHQVTGSLPPADSHTSEAAYTHGRVDALIARADQWTWLMDAVFGPGPRLAAVPSRTVSLDEAPSPEDAWDAVGCARRLVRPSGLEWAGWLSDGWVELRGADPALRAGLASVDGRRTVIIAMDRHAHGDAGARQTPAAYRLARRALALADRLRLPVLTLIDTPGAEPGPAAEADGAAGEIAATLLAMATLRAPSVALCVGEGGSGGAVCLAHTDRLLLLEGAIFTVIGPEAGAVILYRDASRAPGLARAFQLTARQLVAVGVADDYLPDATSAERGQAEVIAGVRAAVNAHLRAARVDERDTRSTQLTLASLTGSNAGPQQMPHTPAAAKLHRGSRGA